MIRFTSRRAILILGGCLCAVAMILFASLIERERRVTVRDANRAAIFVTNVVGEHTARILETGNILAEMMILMAAARAWDAIEVDEDGARLLTAMAERYPYIGALWLVDAEGRPRLTSRGFPAPRVSVASRAHFHAQRDADVGPYVSGLLQSRVADEVNVVMTRRINGPNGDFRGVAMVVFDLADFLQAYRQIQARFPTTIEVFRRDLSLLVRSEGQLMAGEQVTLSAQVLRAAPEGGLLWTEPAAGEQSRLLSYRQVPPFDVYVSAAITEADLNAVWMQTAYEQGLFAAVSLGAIMFLVWLALWQSRREIAASRELDALNATLDGRIRERTETIERLMTELNHRVKNSLQMIAGLLRLHANSRRAASAKRELLDAHNRVMTIARVHDQLYRHDGQSEIDLDSLVRDLTGALMAGLERGAGPTITFACAPGQFRMPVERAVPVALVVNELATNAIKYAYPDGREGRIAISLRLVDRDKAEIVVADDGVGLPPGHDLETSPGLGAALVQGLMQQVAGKMDFETEPGKGARFVLTFSLRGDPAPKAEGT